MNNLWLIFGWSALSIILLIPMSDSPRFVALVSLLVAISSIDFLLTAWEVTYCETCCSRGHPPARSLRARGRWSRRVPPSVFLKSSFTLKKAWSA